MGFFDAFSLLLALTFIVSGFFHHKIRDPWRFRKALAFFMAALILYYPVPGLFGIGIYLSFVAGPAGFVLGVVSLRLLCLALMYPAVESKRGRKDADRREA